MDSFVVFRHENEEFILQNEQIVLNRYHREFGGDKNVEFKTKSNHKHVRRRLQGAQVEQPSHHDRQR